ncbi:MAG: hypothetical protein LC708_00745, partial [Actinobacteria bacterium]|nr:hypothetical protein [Actinomycetota bacterium]
GEGCNVAYTVTALRVPTNDTAPGTPNVQTNQVASASASSPGFSGTVPPLVPVRSSGIDVTTVLPAGPSLVTVAATAPGVPGSSLATTTDTATLFVLPAGDSLPPASPSAIPAPPTGLINFQLFGPFAGDVPDCGGAPVAVREATVNGFGDYSTPTPVDITGAGTYTWVASYSGDANYSPVGPTACGDPAETFTVAGQAPTITTSATPTVTVGGQITDTATISGVFVPPGTSPGTSQGDIVFNLFDNPTCTGSPVFISVVPVTNGDGDYTSGPFTVATPGTYNWVARFVPVNGNNTAVSTACGEPGETSVVIGPLSVQVEKTATPASLPEPGGNVTYTVAVTNTGAGSLLITSLTDDIYGNLAARPGSTCTTAIGTLLVPGATYTCTFTAPFTGRPGASQTDVVTVVASPGPDNAPVADTDDATVTITPVQPTIAVDKTADPTALAEPGGDFTYTVVVTNPNTVEAITITSLNDNIYGDLATRPGSTCGALIGTTLAPGISSFPCTF